MSIHNIAATLVIYHVLQLRNILIYPINDHSADRILVIIQATQRKSSRFQILALIGLLLILSGIFIPILSRIVDTGIPVLGVMGVEFLAHAWMIWILQEGRYRLSR